MNVSLFPKSWDTTPEAEYHIDEILAFIKTGHWQDCILSYRKMVEMFGKRSEQASHAKKALPAFTVSGTFDIRRDSGLIKHSGLVAIDIDDLADVKKASEIVKTDPYIFASFVSAGGHGLCLICKVDPEQHKGKKDVLFEKFKEYFEQRHDIEIDKLQDISRLRFVSYDPYLFQATTSRTFRIESERLHRIDPNGQANLIKDWTTHQRLETAVNWVERNETWTKGSRHNYIRNLAFNANRMGVSKSELMGFISANYPHFIANPSNAVTWVYKNMQHEFGELLDRSYQKTEIPTVSINEPASIEEIEDLLTGRRANWDKPIPKPPAILSIQGGTISTAGNITVITGPSKSGKTGVLNAIKAGCMVSKSMNVDTLGIEVNENKEGKALIYLDTEQSKYNFDRNYRRVVERAGLSRPPKWFEAYWLRGLMPRELLDATKLIAEHCADRHGGVHMFVVDGIGDYVLSVNDDTESNRIVEEFAILAEEHNAPVVTVLHFNPGTMKERGHIGSQLQRKAESILKINKDEAGISTIGYKELRNAGSLEEMQFQWCDQRKMHTLMGNKPKPLSREQKKTQDLRDMAVRLVIGITDKSVLLELIKDELGCSDTTAWRKIQDLVGRKIIGTSDIKKGPFWIVENEDMPF